jgi:hypothetical protein
VVRPTRKTERERMKVGEGAVGGGRTREKSYVECSKAAKSAIFPTRHWRMTSPGKYVGLSVKFHAMKFYY